MFQANDIVRIKKKVQIAAASIEAADGRMAAEPEAIAASDALTG
jgi:hypothetical protein